MHARCSIPNPTYGASCCGQRRRHALNGRPSCRSIRGRAPVMISAGSGAQTRTRVCIVGGGCAGLTAAWSLSRHPDKFEVELWEASSRLGGHAHTLHLNDHLSMNDTVLGGTYASFPNALALLRDLGWQEHRIDWELRFAGAGSPGDPGYLWGTSAGDSPVFQRHARDIRVFGAALELLWRSGQVLLLLLTPLRLLCRLLGCSDAFWSEMVAPLGVVFFGTGLRMGLAPAIILAGTLFQSQGSRAAPVLQLDAQRLVAPRPLPFFNFPRMDLLYQSFAAQAAAAGNVTIRRCHPAVAVHPADDSGADAAKVVDAEGVPHGFDAVILACHARTALQLLPAPSWAQRAALGGVEYHRQSTIMHTDGEYIQRYHPALLQCPGPAWSVQKIQGDYELVYAFSVPFLLQCSDADAARAAADAQHASSSSSSAPPTYTHLQSRDGGAEGLSDVQRTPLIWQVALPGRGCLERLDPCKVVSVLHWEHPAHTVKHFVKTLALSPRIQGRGGLYFAGGWTFVDIHEWTIISGLAAAAQLGAPYPWPHHPAAAEPYKAYVRIVYGPGRA